MGKRRSPLRAKWHKQKTKARRSGYYGRGLMKKPSGFDAFRQGVEVYQYNRHAQQRQHRELCRLFGIDLGVLVEGDPRWATDDPRLLAELRKDELVRLENDPVMRILNYSRFYVTGDASSDFSVSILFGYNEYYIIEKCSGILRRSTLFSDKDRALNLYYAKRVQWAGVHILSDSS